MMALANRLGMVKGHEQHERREEGHSRRGGAMGSQAVARGLSNRLM